MIFKRPKCDQFGANLTHVGHKSNIPDDCEVFVSFCTLNVLFIALFVWGMVAWHSLGTDWNQLGQIWNICFYYVFQCSLHLFASRV